MTVRVDNFDFNRITQNFKSKNKHKKGNKQKTLGHVITQNRKLSANVSPVPTSDFKPVLKPEIKQDLVEISVPKIDDDIQKIIDGLKTEHKNFSIGILGKKLPDYIQYEPCPRVYTKYHNSVERPLKAALQKNSRYDDNWKRREIYYETCDNTIFEVHTYSETAYQDEKIPIIKLIKYKNGDIDYVSPDKWDSSNVYYDSKKQEFSYECEPRKEYSVFDQHMNTKSRKTEREVKLDGCPLTITHTTQFGKNGEMTNIEEAWSSYNKDKLIFYRKSEFDKYENETSRIILDTNTGKFLKKGKDF